MRKSCILFAALILGSAANAGTATGTVTQIHVANHYRTIAFSLDTKITDTPRCNESGRFSIDLAKPGGDAMLQILLEAKREKYGVSVEGLNTCAVEWKSENVKIIAID